jgi:glycerate 2-kinase
MLKKWDAWEEAPESVRVHLSRGDAAHETMKRAEFEEGQERIFGVMPESLGMIPTAAAKARELGFAAHHLHEGAHVQASQYALINTAIAHNVETAGEPFTPPCVLLNGGEMVVTVGKEQGIGGRNQEFALAAATHIAGSPHIVVGSVDTDGTDGPGTQLVKGCEDLPSLAGGIVDGYTAQEAREHGVDLTEALRHHNAAPALCALDSGVIATHNISLNDLTVTLILGRK